MNPTLRIERLVHGGLGLARHEGAVVFVSDVVPGEVVQARVTGRRAQCDFAVPTRIITASPDRRAFFCPYAGECGGCDWQHILPARQVQLKREILSDCLRRVGKIAVTPEPEVFTSPETAYRIRAQFQLAHGGRTVGFHQRASNDPVDIAACPLLAPGLDAFLGCVRESAARLPSGVRKVMAVVGDGGRVASSPVLPPHSGQHTTVSVGARCFRLRGQSFFQNNRFLHEQLATWAAPLLSGARCLDLYGGAGFFSVMLAERFEEITLVELVPELARLAQATFEQNGLRHCTAVCSSVEKFSAAPGPTSAGIDCILVDPPRQGLTREVLDNVAALAPPQLLYVSCDPATLARDIGALCSRHGYAIDRLALFDLYPNTHHLETEVLLRRTV